jgi:hypothetical protein
MKKNVAGQKIGAQMCATADGSAFAGSVTVYVTGDAGTQAIGSVGSGACTHEGNGYHTYAPSQAETNYDLIAFTFIGTGAIPATVQVATVPTDGIASQSSIDDIPTNAELAAALGTADDATLAAIAAVEAAIASATSLLATASDLAIVAGEVGKIPRKATAIAAGAAATKTNTATTPNQSITEVIT